VMAAMRAMGSRSSSVSQPFVSIIRFICLKTQHHKKTFITENITGVAKL